MKDFLPWAGVIALFLWPGAAASEESAPRFEFDGPHVVVDGASVTAFSWRAVNQDGRLLENFSDEVRIEGLLVRSADAASHSDWREHSAVVSFSSGVLRVTPEGLQMKQLSAGPADMSLTHHGQTVVFPVAQRAAWLRLVPPLIAIGLAIVLREVTVSLLLATLAGCLLYQTPGDSLSAISVLCDILVQQVADADHAAVILFTVLLGAMISLMNASGGTQAAIRKLSGFARTRRRGMVLTWLMGILVFFDDYSNTMLVGGAMRPLSDRLKFSRAKLAFLIDSTAAPLAGLAISTWTAFEIDQVAAGFSAAGIDADAAQFFWSTIPYRIYPILALAVVGAVAVSGRDFGAMLKAEQSQEAENGTSETLPAPTSLWLAVVPVVALVVITVVGFFCDVDAYRLLLLASLVSSGLAFVLAWGTRCLSLQECAQAGMTGIESMVPATVILVLAWSVSAVCRSDQLDTAGYITALIGDSVRPQFLPAAAFLTAGAVAVSIGSSFTTMALLIPMLTPLAWLLTGGSVAADVGNPVFAATIGAILSGAVFGDHCSPISDTTVLSSAAAGCDHLQHVATQLPYAVLTAIASLLLGYLPVGFGVPWWLCLPAALAVCVTGFSVLGQVPQGSEDNS